MPPRAAKLAVPRRCRPVPSSLDSTEPPCETIAWGPELHRWLQPVSQWLYTSIMSTLTEVEAVVARFSAAELAELEQFVRQTRIEKTRGEGRSALWTCLR